jgi:hypothetical protein
MAKKPPEETTIGNPVRNGPPPDERPAGLPPPPPASGSSLLAAQNANDRRLALAHQYLDECFVDAVRKRLWGRVAIIVPFQNGEAGDIHHENSGRVRLN